MLAKGFRIAMRLRAIVVGLMLAGGLWTAGVEIVPGAQTAWRWWSAAEDPAALARLALPEMLTPGRLAAELDAAVAAEDLDMARSFLALAESQGVAVDPAGQAKIEALAGDRTWAATRSFLRGAFVGDAEGLSGTAGAFAADLTGYGDLRDLAREGWHAARSQPVDEIVVGLSVVGLAVTGATWVLAGAPAPVRAGLTLVKAARKAGRLSAPLARALGGMVRAAVDTPAVGRALAAAARFDLAAARRAAAEAVRPDRLAPLADLGEDAAMLYRRAGAAAVGDALALAEGADDIRRIARLAEGLGQGTRAALKLLGRAAIVLTRSLFTLFGWLFAAVGYAWALASTAAALGRWLARATPPHPRRRARRIAAA